MSEVITNALKQFESDLLSSVEVHISHREKLLLDELFETYKEECPTEGQQILKLKRHNTEPYKVTLLKKSHQSIKPSKIKENIKDLEYLKTLFEELKPIIKQLDLAPEIVNYYAQLVIKSQVFQISRREEKKYLYIIAFVIHQYYRLNDILIETLMQAVQSALNTGIRDHKEAFYKTRKDRHQTINLLAKTLNEQVTTLQQIEEIIYRQNLTAEAQVETIKSLFSKENKQDYYTICERLALLEKESQQITRNDDYYNIMESKSVKLQNRVSGIIKHIDFDNTASDDKVIEAIKHYREKDGRVEFDAMVEFLDVNEQAILFNEKGKFRILLYKVLLFENVAASIKAGTLNLQHSYKYRAFDNYLIPQDVWRTRKSEFLRRAGLEASDNFQKVFSDLKQKLQFHYQITNENLNAGKNEYAKVDTEGGIRISTPKVEQNDSDIITDLFPQNQFISLFEVLSTINKFSKFLDCFQHWQIKYNREKPEAKTFIAGIIGYGCNLGIHKIAKISRNINQNELENTVNWYFASDNLNNANDKILKLMEHLQLPQVFKKDENKTHTSSDGQKFNIGVDSLNANYSYKYFGKGKGVSVYSFIDESHRLFYSTVISSSEREAAYVIDGLMYNDVLQSDIHSTDTHGYSEMIFGIAHLLGISFAPRIKQFEEQRLYSFERKVDLKTLGYALLPDGQINTKIIWQNWDDILRFVTTIKLKETPASQLLRRLSSYSRQHPLYRALKEFGKIIKSIFMLKYIDDVKLRQMIEKQLNKLESSNKLSKAVFYGNNQEFQQSTKEEQLIAEGCKRLIENSIICWNYLYLSQLIYNAETEAQKQSLIQTIKNSSVVTWHHINLHGEYDFSEENLRDSIKFRFPELSGLKTS
jgi:TnpA family transposase